MIFKVGDVVILRNEWIADVVLGRDGDPDDFTVMFRDEMKAEIFIRNKDGSVSFGNPGEEWELYAPKLVEDTRSYLEAVTCNSR